MDALGESPGFPEVGTGYFDAVMSALSGGQSSTTALQGSTEAAQFDEENDERMKRSA